MRRLTKHNKETFLELVRAGLWEKRAQLLSSENIDYDVIYKLAEEQRVVGLVTSGLELLEEIRPPKEVLLNFVGISLQLEQQNKSMNTCIVRLTNKLKDEGVHALLVKGQGVAQCYERPMWRASGDIDLLLDERNYEKAKEVLFPIADIIEGEEKVAKHQALNIKGFEVELHGRMPFFLSQRVDDVIEAVLTDSLAENGCRSWKLYETDVYIPKPDNDVIIVFTHLLHHFFIEGVGLRQICDWCRLLWTYRESLNHGLLESRIKEAGLMTEWKAFSALAVNTLGMPKEAMPFYDARFKKKGERVLKRVLVCGNFGHNNDLSYRTKYTGMRYKMVAMWRRFLDFASLIPVFPVDAPKFFVTYVFGKAK